MAAQKLTTSAKGGVEIHGLLYGLAWFLALDALETKNELNTRFLSKSRSREKHLKEITPGAIDNHGLVWYIRPAEEKRATRERFSQSSSVMSLTRSLRDACSFSNLSVS